MADRFYLDPSGVAGVTARTRGLNRRLNSAMLALDSVLVARHGCWGTDDIGKAFSNNYVESERKTREGNADAVEGLDSYAVGLDRASANFQQVDADNAALVDGVIAAQLRTPPA